MNPLDDDSSGGRGTGTDPTITVYTMHMCGGCEALKTFLRELDVEFAERPLMDPSSITELRMSGCYEKVESLQAPILEIGDRVMRYDDLFIEGELCDLAVLRGCMASIPALEAEVAQKDARIAELIGERDSLMDQCHGLQRLADERDGLRMRVATLEKALVMMAARMWADEIFRYEGELDKKEVECP